MAELDQHRPTPLVNRHTVWYPFATHEELESRINGWWQRVRFGVLSPESQPDLCGVLDEMWLEKDAHEPAIMPVCCASGTRCRPACVAAARPKVAEEP